MQDIWADPEIGFVYGHLKSPALSVQDLFRDLHSCLKQRLEGTVIEIEARLGSFKEGRGFQSDLGRDTFYLLLQELESYKAWHSVADWSESHDVFYSIDLPGEFGRRADIRTSVREGPSGELQLFHLIKRKLKAVDFSSSSQKRSSEPGFLSAPSPQQEEDAAPCEVALRVSSSIETEVPPELIPAAVVPKYVRIKQRKKFLLASVGIDQPVFCFDFSIVYAGKNKTEAERLQAAGQQGATFEVEIECLEPLLYLKSCDGHEGLLALSLLLKGCDLISILAKRPVSLQRTAAQ